MRPVSSSEIKSFLNASSISFSEGYACYVTTCVRHCRKRIRINELDKLFINSTTGTFTHLFQFVRVLPDLFSFMNIML